ncbi:LPS translocon maturation chaperone LptM [Vibrio tapetis]
MKKSFIALFLLSILGLAGCGQSGALYLPDDAPPTEQPQQ